MAHARTLTFACVVVCCLPRTTAASEYSAALSVNLSAPIAHSPTHLVSLGWELHWMLSALDNMTVPNSPVAAIMSHLAPAVVRVGGICADWARYVLDNGAWD